MANLNFLLEYSSADFRVYYTSNKITLMCECELFIEVPKMYICTNCNVGKVYLSCVSAVHFLVVLVIQILMAWLCGKSIVLPPVQPCDSQKPLDDNCTALTLS